MDQALHRIRKLHVQSVRGDAGNHAVVFFPDMALHIIHLLQLYRLPLCLVGPALCLAGMLRHL